MNFVRILKAAADDDNNNTIYIIAAQGRHAALNENGDKKCVCLMAHLQK